jgi:hypothetical protein
MDQRYLMAWHSISDLWDMVRRVEEYLKARQGEMGKRDGLKEEEEGGGSTTSDGEESGGTL